MKALFLLIPSIILLVSTSSCNHFEMIPLSDKHNQIDTIDSLNLKSDRFFSFNSDEKFGEVPPSTITVSKSTQNSSRSYIDCSIKTTNANLINKPDYSKGINLLRWIGLIISIVFFIIGLNVLTNYNKEKGSRIIQYFKMISFLSPLVLYFIFVDYPFLFLILWFIMFLPLLAIWNADEFNILFAALVLLIFLFVGICGYKAGSKVYFDNASDKSVGIKIDGKYVGELPSMRHTKLRLSGIEPKIEILSNDTVIETVYIPINRNYKVLIKQSIFPWSNYIYNINGKNFYKVNNISYY